MAQGVLIALLGGPDCNAEAQILQRSARTTLLPCREGTAACVHCVFVKTCLVTLSRCGV